MPTSLASYPESNMTPEPFFKDERALSQPLSESSSFVGEENDDSNSQTIYSESIPPWKKNQENLLQQVEVREKSVKIAFAELARIKLVLDPHKKIPEVKQLLAAIAKAGNLKKTREVTVGFVGATGVGKSLLIQAILGLRNIVPSDSARACTSAIVKLLWNAEDDPEKAFRAEIEFLTKEEMGNELQCLYSDIAREEREKDAEYGVDEELVQRIKEAMSKVTCVWPFIRTPNDLKATTVKTLLKHPNAANLGEKCLPIECSNLKEFAFQIRPFIVNKVSSTKSPGQWPLVRMINIYLKADILEPGIVIMDVPGNMDENAARTAQSEKNLKNLSVACVLSRSDRAPSDAGAQELMNKATQQMLILDGVKRVCYIMTKTDQLDSIDNYIQEHPDVEEQLAQILERQQQAEDYKSILKEQLEKISNMKVEARKEYLRLYKDFQDTEKRALEIQLPPTLPQKRKLGVADWVEVCELPSLSAEEKKLVGDLLAAQTKYKRQKDHENKIKANEAQARLSLHAVDNCLQETQCLKTRACIQHRNETSSAEIKSNFLQAMQETGSGQTKLSLEVFSVSALMSLNMVQKEPTEGYLIPSDTQIPALKKFLVETTLQARHENATAILDYIDKFILQIKAWAIKPSLNLKISSSLREQLEKKFAEQVAEHKEKRSTLNIKAGNNFRFLVRKELFEKMRSMEKVAYEKALEVTLGEFEWTPKLSEIVKKRVKLFWSTYRAIAKGNGRFKCSRGQQYDWNQRLAQDLLDELVPAWKAVFQERLPQQLNWYTQEAQRIFGDLCKSVIASAEERFPRIAEPLNLFRDKIPQLQEDIVSYAKDAYDEDISGYAKDVWRLVSPAIRETMLNGYQAAGAEKGKKATERIREKLTGHLKQHGKLMYQSANFEIKEALNQLGDELSRILEEAPQKLDEEISDFFHTMLDQHSEDGLISRRLDAKMKIKLGEEIHTILENLSVAWKAVEASPEEEEEPLIISHFDLDKLINSQDIINLASEDEDDEQMSMD